MSNLYCTSCSFEQDNFWNSVYNPIRCLQNWAKDLLEGDLEFVNGNENKNLQEVIAIKCEQAAVEIRKMMYRTELEYKKENPKGICPFCGGKLKVKR